MATADLRPSVERFVQARTVLAIVFWLGIVTYALTLSMSRAQFGITFLGGAVVLYCLYEMEPYLIERDWPWVGLFSVLAVAFAAGSVYMYANFSELLNIRVGFNTQADFFFALVLLVIVIYLTYREYGLPFATVIFATLIYAYFGNLFPSWLNHTGLGTERILQTGVLNIEGIYGNLTQIMGTWIALFLLYAGLVQGYGAFDLILRGARKAAEYVDSGVAQAAILASVAIGSVNGSATANTGITGSITIDMMKRNGIKAETAAAIEAVASSGGQIMPPVMGAAAFLMASLLSMPYGDILSAAVLPALIFYIPVTFAVHYNVASSLREQETDLSELIQGEIPRRVLLYQGVQYLIPFVVLIVTLGILGYSIMYSALVTNVVMVLTGIVFPMARNRNWAELRAVAVRTVDGLNRGAQSTARIAIVIASIGLVVDLLLTTGIPSKLSLAIMEISGGVFFVAIVLALLVSIILGMGMPTSASYLIVALLIAPTLVRNFAVPELAVHFFVFYGAILSALTPPIAVGIVVATGIAESDFWKTTARAFQIGFPVFLLPFLFMYHPEIVAREFTPERLITAATALGGMIVIAYASNIPFAGIRRTRQYTLRLAYIAAGVGALFLPGMVLRIGCLLVGGLIYLAQQRIVFNDTSVKA